MNLSHLGFASLTTILAVALPVGAASAAYPYESNYYSGYAPSYSYTAGYVPTYTAGYAPTYTTAYAPTYTSSYVPGYTVGYTPGPLARLFMPRYWGWGGWGTYTTAYAPTASYGYAGYTPEACCPVDPCAPACPCDPCASGACGLTSSSCPSGTCGAYYGPYDGEPIEDPNINGYDSDNYDSDGASGQGTLKPPVEDDATDEGDWRSQKVRPQNGEGGEGPQVERPAPDEPTPAEVEPDEAAGLDGDLDEDPALWQFPSQPLSLDMPTVSTPGPKRTRFGVEARYCVVQTARVQPSINADWLPLPEETKLAAH